MRKREKGGRERREGERERERKRERERTSYLRNGAAGSPGINPGIRSIS